MKTILKFFFIITFFSVLISCHKDDINKITFQNNSQLTLKLMYSIAYPDTSVFPIEDCNCNNILPFSKSDCISNVAWNHANESNILLFYIWDRDTVNKYGFDICRNEYKIIKRYQLSVKELENMGWTIAYP